MPEWTKEQQEAIEARGTNLLVSAAAGSGKTAVMIERIYRLIAEGESIDRMMVVTFTNMAAASMRDKLAERLDEALADDPANEHLLRQRSLLDRASISTIHSFCLQLLKRYYFKTPLPPDFHLLDATQETMIADAAMKQILEEASKRYESGSFPAYGQVLTQFTSRNTDRDLEDTLRFLSQKVRSMTDPNEFFDKTLSYFADETGAVWKNALMASFTESLREAIDYLKEIERVFSAAEPQTGEFVAYYAEPFVSALEETTPEGMLEKLSFRTKQNRSKNPAFKKSVKAVVDFRNELAKRLTKMLTFRPIDVRESVEALFELLKAYEARKKDLMLAESGVTFDDLLHGTLDLFRDHPDIQEDIRQSIDYIFVDEYQDVNILQNTIVESLSKGDNLFFVGDIKQCIYGFQLARPDLFSDKIRLYGQGVIGRRIDLKNNFRSNAAILDAVNALFEPLMTARTAILPYDDEAKLMASPAPDAPQYQPGFFSEGKPETPCEMMLCIGDHEEAMIGRRILELTKCTFLSKDGERPVLYRDIAVLTRDNKSAAELAAALNAMGIPAVAADEQEEDQSDAFDVLALLRVLLLRRSDLDLITVMLREFSATELVNIRVFTEDRSCSFYDACLRYDGDPALKEKITALFARLDKLNLLESAMSLPNFLEYLLENEGYRYTAVFRNGQAGEKALNELVFAARTYSEFGKGGLRGFLSYYDHYQTDTRKTMTVNESDNAVRLMTIHKSKGLEFPVVILAGTHKTPRGGHKGKLYFDETLGLGFCPAEEDELGVRTIADYALSKDAITENQKREERMEELRLLYVALTRAQNKLILSMAQTKKTESFADQFCLPGDLVTASADNYASLLLPLLYYHRDGQPLRDLNEDAFTEPLFDQGSWDVRVYPEGAFVLPESAAAEPEDEVPDDFDESAYLAMSRASFAWRYPYEAAIRARTKQNPSKQQLRQRIPLRRPAFVDQEYTGAQKGTVVHFFMEHADFVSGDDARTQAERMKAAGILSRDEFDALPFDKLDAFFACPIGQRMKKSGQINRERSFCLIVPFPETGDEALVQGIIDCYFFEGDTIVLLDYKTDAIHDNLADRVAHHTPQLKMYQAALEQMYPGKTVTPYLYFFSVDKTVLVI